MRKGSETKNTMNPQIFRRGIVRDGRQCSVVLFCDCAYLSFPEILSVKFIEIVELYYIATEVLEWMGSK